jgi:branched-chain amino acid transport system ATP-binding protein
MALLDARSITVRFGGNEAVSDADLTAEVSTITGLIGPNGAGKTTLFNVITGLMAPTRGRVFVDDEDITALPPFKRARRGLARTFQRLELFGLLTVRENLMVAADIRRGWAKASARSGVSLETASPADTAERIIEEIGLAAVADVRADALPTGQARLVELGRAMATRPRLLLLDEPASGQDEQETARFAAVLRRLRSQGLAVVLVEHDMSLVMDVCDTIHVLDFGKILAVGTPTEIRGNEAVLAAYLGSGASTGRTS